jgi:NAD-dependent DNA ligase
MIKKPYNKIFINTLQEFIDLYYVKNDVMRSRVYKKALDSLMMLKEPINSLEDIKKIKNIGKSTITKFKELIDTGKIEVLERMKDSPLYKLTKIYGVGPKKAKELVEKHNIRTIEELEVNQELLNDKQKIGLKYYYDILKRIPRDEIIEYDKLFNKILENINNNNEYKSSFEIVGSYRRNANDSGDIDVIIKNENDDNILNKFIDELIKQKIIVEVLSQGSKKSMLICKLSEESIPRRVDLMFSIKKEYPFAILYFTGNALFNTLMRSRALELGLTLNEHGFSKMDKGSKGELLDLNIKEEKDIFKILKMKYKNPEERVGIESLEYIEEKELMKYKSEGIKYLEKCNESELEKLLKQANNNYYNEEDVILNDEMYDILKEYIERLNPKNEVIKEVGATIERNKAVLPYYMGSMDKIKPNTEELDKWKIKYTGPEYVLSAKLDGVSGLYVKDKEGNEKLYTRGNGEVGQDISDFIPYLKSRGKIPVFDDFDEGYIAVRGEFIISKKEFDTKYSKEASNSRNLVSGIINSKHVSLEKIDSIQFVAYEIIKQGNTTLSTSSSKEQLMSLQILGFETVKYEIIDKENLTNENLSDKLQLWRDSYEYEIDGIIVTDNNIYERKRENPKHSFAFKMILTDQMVEAKVLDVLWNPSKDGYLKPRVRIEPVNIGGVVIEYATGFNGLFIKENKIGCGSIVKLVRSGDVIPHILDVVKKSKDGIMPDYDYIWNETGVDIMLSKDNMENNQVVQEKKLLIFFDKLGVVGLGLGNIKRIMKAGYKTIESILNMSKDNYLEVEGFKEKMSTKIYNSLRESIDRVDELDLLVALGVFGRGIGKKKLEAITNKYPDYFSELLDKEAIIKEEEFNKILKVEGFAKKTSDNFVNSIGDALRIIRTLKLEYKFMKKEVVVDELDNDEDKKLFDKKVVFTGFRSKELEELVKKSGGEVVNSITKKTDYLVVKSKDDNEKKSSKILKAEKLGIEIVSELEFKEYIKS